MLQQQSKPLLLAPRGWDQSKGWSAVFAAHCKVLFGDLALAATCHDEPVLDAASFAQAAQTRARTQNRTTEQGADKTQKAASSSIGKEGNTPHVAPLGPAECTRPFKKRLLQRFKVVVVVVTA